MSEGDERGASALARLGGRGSGEPARHLTALLVLVALLTAALVGSLCIGTRTVLPVEVWRAFADFAGTDDHLVVRDLRVPRTVLGIAVGAALGVSGTLVQTLSRNPLAEPGLLGVTAGASCAIVVATAVWGLGGQVGQLIAALVGAALATVLVYAVGRSSPARLLLAGVALTAVLAGVSLGIRLVLPDVFDSYRFWSVGSLAGREQVPLLWPLAMIAAGLIGALLLTRPLAAIALGDTVARALGVNLLRTRSLAVLLVTVLAGAATAVAGPIVFVGLIVPHLARRFADGSLGWLMAYTLVLGPALMLGADVLARVLLPVGEVPVAVVTTFLGGPMLVWVVRRYGVVNL